MNSQELYLVDYYEEFDEFKSDLDDQDLCLLDKARFIVADGESLTAQLEEFAEQLTLFLL